MITAFASFQDFVNGVGESPLLDAISCIVTEQRNGCFDLLMQYPLNGQYASLIVPNSIIYATPRPNATQEPFRIYEIEQTITGLITARAHHIAYDLDGMLATGMNQYGITNSISIINGWIGSYYEIVNDGITDEQTQFKIIVPESCFAAIGGNNSLLSHFGGELSYHWDDEAVKCYITLHAQRGTAKNTIITYGVNIISLNRKQTVGEMYSAVVAFWSDGENASNTAWSYIIPTGVTAITRTLMLDCSKTFDSKPTSSELNAIVNEYIDGHDFTMQSELSVDFVPLENTSQYKPLNVAIVGSAIVGTNVVGTMENMTANGVLELCDIATIDASLVGVTANAQCVEVVYNVLFDKCERVTIGTLQNTIVDTIVNLMEG